MDNEYLDLVLISCYGGYDGYFAGPWYWLMDVDGVGNDMWIKQICWALMRTIQRME